MSSGRLDKKGDSIKRNFKAVLQQADQLFKKEQKFAEALKLYNELALQTECSPLDRVIVLYNRGALKGEGFEQFEEAIADNELSLLEATKIKDFGEQQYRKQWIEVNSFVIFTRAIIILDDVKKIEEYKQKGAEKIEQLKDMGLPKKLTQETEKFHQTFQNVCLLKDLLCSHEKETKTSKDSLSLRNGNNYLLYFLLYTLENTSKSAIENFKLFLKGNNIRMLLRMYRKPFFIVILNPCLFNQNLTFDDKQKLNFLKDEILKYFQDLPDSLRIRVKIHALCENTFLGHIFNSATSSLKPSLGRKGRLLEIAKSLSMEAKIEIDQDTRALLDQHEKLRDELEKYFPELHKKLYPLKQAQLKYQDHLFFELKPDEAPQGPVGTINQGETGNRYITNAHL